MNAEKRKNMLLREIRALTREINALAAEVKSDGLMTTGSKGQPVAHPAIALGHAARARRLAALEGLRRLERDNPDEIDDALEAFLETVPDARRFQGRA